MTEFGIALALAALPAAGNVAGGVLALAIPLSRSVLSYALHAAAGVVLAVVGLELMPRAIDTRVPWVPILAFVAGGAFFLLVDSAIGFVTARMRGPERESAPWVIYAGVAIDLFADGLMIGTGALVGTTFAFLLAIGQVPADIPEGFAVIAGFRRRGMSTSRLLAVAAAFVVPVVAGTALGYWVMRGRSEVLQLSLLAFAAGMLASIVVEELVPEAHRGGEDPRAAALLTVVGFAAFALLSASLA